jgi:hypothetical protein
MTGTGCEETCDGAGSAIQCRHTAELLSFGEVDRFLSGECREVVGPVAGEKSLVFGKRFGVEFGQRGGGVGELAHLVSLLVPSAGEIGSDSVGTVSSQFNGPVAVFVVGGTDRLAGCEGVVHEECEQMLSTGAGDPGASQFVGDLFGEEGDSPVDELVDIDENRGKPIRADESLRGR